MRLRTNGSKPNKDAQAELSAFDHQLDVLEKSLAPMESWIHQLARLRQSLTETLHPAAPEPRSPND